MSYVVAVVGATGAVGQEMIKILEQRHFPVEQLVPLASTRSAGKKIHFAGKEVEVQPLSSQSFQGVQIALFSAGGPISREYAPIAVKAGAIVIDNTSAFRTDPEIPLVVPEVNPETCHNLKWRIIANPNCSTIQMVVALNPIRQAAGIRRIVVSTYQSVSGAGRRAMEELKVQAQHWAAGEPLPSPIVFPHSILFECLPQIGDFLPNGYTVEEEKMINETRKIFNAPKLAVTATTVRVPVMVAHSESVNVETEKSLSAQEARELLAKAPGVQVIDDPSRRHYPLAKPAAGTDPVYVGRIRHDPSVENGLNLWVVSDNLRKGAALNAVQIAEYLVEHQLV